MRAHSLRSLALCLLLMSGVVHAEPRRSAASAKSGSASKVDKHNAPPPEPPAPASPAPTTDAAGSKSLPPLGAGSVFALLPATSGKPGPAAGAGDVAKAISEHLKTAGFRVLPANQVHGQLSSHALEGCKNPTTCDPALALATLGADAVISIAVWQRKAAPPQVVVYVRRQHGYGQAEVSARGAHAQELRTAAVSALQTALEDSQRTHEIDVLIESLPIGATVHVDQALSGTTPAHFALLPGSHLVSVEAPGFVTRAQYLELSDQSEQKKLHVQLTAAETEVTAAPAANKRRGAARTDKPRQPEQPQEAPAPATSSYTSAPPRAQRETSSGMNYVVAAILLGVAAPFIANAIYAGATRGKCVGPMDAAGLCSERVGLGPAFFASVGVGAAAALTGATFLVVQPLTETGPVPQGAQLQLTQRF